MFFNIAQDFMVRVSAAYGHTMLQVFGNFADKQLSDTKINVILEHSKELTALITSWEDGASDVSETLSIVRSTWNGNKMIQLIGEFKSQRLSANLVSQLLKYGTELRKILADNSPATVQAEQVKVAESALQKKSAAIGTDKKSAKDKGTVVVTPSPATPHTFNGYATIQAYLQGTYKFNQIDADFYAMDESAQKEYQDYPKANTRPSFAEMKKSAAPVPFADAKKESAKAEKSDTPSVKSDYNGGIVAVKTSDHKTVKEFKTAQSAAKGKAIPVSYLVRFLNGHSIDERAVTGESKSDFVAQLHNRQIMSYNESYKSPLLVKDFAITNQGYTQAHLFNDVLIPRGFLKAIPA